MTLQPETESKLKDLLHTHHDWPCEYQFKFIVEKANLDEVMGLFPGVIPVMRPSAKGSYVSLSFFVLTQSADAVMSVYEKSSRIKGIISL